MPLYPCLCIPCSYRLQLVFAKFNLAFNGNAVLFVYRLSCIDCVYPIVHIVAPFLKKETELLTVLLYRQQPRKSMMGLENLMSRLPHSPACRRTCGTPHKAAVQLPAFCRFLLRREHRGEIFQRDFLSLKSHDFGFLFVSDSGTYKITFPFHAAASAVSVPPVYPAGYGQPDAVNCPVRFSALPVPSYLSSCLFHRLLPLLPAFRFPLTGH